MPRNILITGASQGIGAAAARAFAAAGDAHVVLVARNKEKLAAVADECRALGAAATAVGADLTVEADVAKMASEVTELVGLPDVLVSNAGGYAPGATVETSLADFQKMIDVNLTSAFLVTRVFLGEMIERRSGTILYTASVASIRGYPGGAAYCAAKHGLLGLARALREETKEFGIRVTALLPGATRTSSWDGVDLPEERFIDPDDVAAAMVDICRLSPRTVVEEMLIRPQLGDV